MCVKVKVHEINIIELLTVYVTPVLIVQIVSLKKIPVDFP